MSVRCVSIDIGWKHLAFVMLEVGCLTRRESEDQGEENENDFSIKMWGCENLLSETDTSVNVNQTSLDELIRLTVPTVAKIVEKWTKWPGQSTLSPMVAFLEQQPLGMQARNVKSKTLSHVLQGLLLSKGIPVVFVSPQKKLKYMDQSGTYSDNKKFAIAETERLLMSIDPNESSNVWLKHFHSFKKKDDLADSFLQGLYSSKDYLVSLAKEEAKALKMRMRAPEDVEPSNRSASAKKRKLNKKSRSVKAVQESISLDEF